MEANISRSLGVLACGISGRDGLSEKGGQDGGTSRSSLIGGVRLRKNLVMVLGLYEYICSLTKKANLFYLSCVCALVKM